MKIIVNDQIVELYKEFCRLKGYQLPKSPIDALIDQAVGAEEAHMKEFSEWFVTDVLSRLQLKTNQKEQEA